jgi:hypothetical protein
MPMYRPPSLSFYGPDGFRANTGKVDCLVEKLRHEMSVPFRNASETFDSSSTFIYGRVHGVSYRPDAITRNLIARTVGTIRD